MAKTLEIEFKGGRKAFVSNEMEFPCMVGDLVIVEAEKGEDLGRIVNMGYLVDQRAGDQDLPKLIRKPSPDDLKQSEENARLEEQAVHDCKLRIEEHGLDMKLVDAEYQFDRKKITFYFTSEKRVDFRALVRDLAAKYRTRIELRQIGVRDEAKRIGGVGVCGRRLCCTTFLREFAPVTTQFAKDQNLALNPTKLSGACGRLMCCLLYEREFYQEAAKAFPRIGTVIQTEKGSGRISRIDIFKETAVLQYEGEQDEILSLEALKTLLQSSKKKKKKRRGGMKNKMKRKEEGSVEQ